MTHGTLAHIGGTMDIIISSVLAAALAIATVTDLKRQRIYNWLTFPLITTGLGAHTIHAGWDGLILSSSGFALGLFVMFIPFLLGMMGAGDVKLMAGIGAWLGVNTTFTAFLLTSIIGGIYALLVMIRHREYMKAIFMNIWGTFLRTLSTRTFDYSPIEAKKTLPRLCYGVAITIGTLGAMIFNYTQTGTVLAL
ncbi:A24 family peptidase [Pseudodesulfovibrio piezophilus]|uniref:Peptidase A24A prepilin type IV n=1 Tax=Pseudodesulfovibrio piezophilus (strain DSM 21447 / JCM 15486 / C1TLV30) TaxID=1322246 RepID=M1WLY9_PSEP2|nr:A24 family peptidase [Pseudodesulfovibrio piezophilus]CCH48690.1 Peptidase A24A prepilin type IV [Pseudodesulfovibrio piezophilus C1TLV30]